jgi:hypothetical protein
LISFLQQHPEILLIAVVAFWIVFSILMPSSTGCSKLVDQYPDQAEKPMLRLRGQSGTLGRGKMRSVLKLSACPSGLRVGMSPFMGPLCRPFLCLGSILQSSERTRYWARLPNFNSAIQ